MATFDGIKMRKAHHLGYRRAVEGETNAFGEELDHSHVVIVSKSDCGSTRGHDGRECYDPVGVEPHCPQNPEAGSGMVYAAEWNKQRHHKLDGSVDVYWTLPVYQVHDGVVYQGRIRTDEDPYESRVWQHRKALLEENE